MGTRATEAGQGLDVHLVKFVDGVAELFLQVANTIHIPVSFQP